MSIAWLSAFKWKKPNSLMEMASTLGLEKRQNFRIRYPERGALGDLPAATFAGHALKIQNISVGGCCILDPDEILGPDIGQEITLTFHWEKDSHDIRCRIVSRVDSRRHIMFLNVSEKNQARVRKHLEPAYRGSSLRRVDSGTSKTLIEACEIWVSILEDSVTLFDHPHLLGSILYHGTDYLCYRHSFPVFGNDRKRVVSSEFFETLVLFLANIPNPSPPLQQFLAELCLMGTDHFR
jgi:hypothetical protein